MKIFRPILLGAGALACAAAVVLSLAVMNSRREADPACVTRMFEGSRFIVCAFDTRRHQLRLVSEGPDGQHLRSFTALQAALGRDARRVRFAMNAGMFNPAGAPIGLYVAEGHEQHVLRLTDGPGNFHMKPNGVFWIDDAGLVHIDTSDAYAAAAPSPHWATQSGPMLVIDGRLHPRFAADGASRLMRNGVGARDGRTAYFVISGGFVSFGRFARFFRDELGCTDALFLDGSVSSLWAPSLGRTDDDHALGPMVVVMDR
ncbi:MAG: phosphodiester glycosidase family protein [Vitreimonas sp.]